MGFRDCYMPLADFLTHWQIKADSHKVVVEEGKTWIFAYRGGELIACRQGLVIKRTAPLPDQVFVHRI